MLRGLLVTIALIVSVGARADDTPVDVAEVLDGKSITHLPWLEDEEGTLTVADVARRADAFRSDGRGPTVALSRSTFWVRLPVQNRDPAPRRWLLELVYPHLDEVTLYTPRADGGYDALETGDMRVFRQRDVWVYNFVFDRTEPPRGERTYFLRIHSRGKVSFPLRAWEPVLFYQHQLAEWAVFCGLYGALLVMAAYVVCIFFVLGGREHLYYAAYLLTALAADFTLSGHTFQFLLPNHPELVHRLLPLVIECGYVSVIWMIGAQMRALGIKPPEVVRYVSLVLLVVISSLPYELAVKAMTVHVALLLPAAIYAAWSFAKQGARAAGQFVTSFSLPLLGVLLTSMSFTFESERDTLMRWAFMAGVLAQAVLVSSQLADQLNVARARLAASNALHTERIALLSAEMGRATRAGQEAERATLMRDRFMATLSHEFRTPLNAIINIPAALRGDFRELLRVTCGRCAATFELDPGEVVDAAAPCPACGAAALAQAQGHLEFVGDGRQAKELLRRVLRSGRRLLRVVNDILHFSRMQAKRIELMCEHVSVAEAVRASIAQATRHMLLTSEDVRVEVSEELHVWADEERLIEVFMQLLDNAVKFASGTCKVTIAAIRRGDECLITVEDEGIGIEPADRERIFAEFEQVSSGDNRRYGGTGLGLTLCRAIVEAHGGKIWVESNPGAGSVFCLTLPGSWSQPHPTLVPA